MKSMKRIAVFVLVGLALCFSRSAQAAGIVLTTTTVGAVSYVVVPSTTAADFVPFPGYASFNIPANSLVTPSSFLLIFAEEITSLPSTFDSFRSKLPNGSLRNIFELAPANVGDVLPDRLNVSMLITLPRNGGAVALLHWNSTAGIWETLPFSLSGDSVDVYSDFTGLYAVLDVTSAVPPSRVVAFPQPAVGRTITLRAYDSGGGDVLVSFYNVQGEKVLTRTVALTASPQGGGWAGDVSLDVSDLSSGIYDCRLESLEGGWNAHTRLAVVR